MSHDRTLLSLYSAPAKNYLPAAEAHESIFRGILGDLKEHREARPLGEHIPEDLDAKASLPEIYEKFSGGSRHGRFTILDFARHRRNTATISYQILTSREVYGAMLEYNITRHPLKDKGVENSVDYDKKIWEWHMDAEELKKTQTFINEGL